MTALMKRAQAGLAQSLMVALLAIACVCALQVSTLLTQVGETLQAHSAAAVAIEQRMDSVLARADRVAATAEAASIEQRIYAKATAKAAAISALRFGRLLEEIHGTVGLVDQTIGRLDERASILGGSTRQVLASADAALQTAGRQVEENGNQARLALAALRGNLEQSERLWPRVAAVAEHADALVQETTRGMNHAANVAETADIATQPYRKGGRRTLAVLKWIAARFTWGLLR